MNATGTITMSMTELDRLKVVQAVCERRLKPGQAADRLALSVRQVERLVQRYQAAGVAGLVSGRRGRPGNHQLSDGVARRALAIIRERYADFGPTLACEKLRECHGIGLSVETVRALMIAAGLWIPRRDRPPKVYQPRNRRACQGELIQIDGSDHRWFEDRAPACTLLVFIDDATGRLMTLHFTATESTFSYFEALHKYLGTHGKPVAFYSDKASVFYVKGRSETAGKGVTQFGRALYELNIETFCANTSQAKGRVERANLTLQDRLVKELRLRGISSRELANAYVPSFIADFNRRFGKPPKSDHNAHRPVRDDEDLRQILAYRVARKVTHSLTVQYDRVMYLLEDTLANRRLIHEYVEVVEYPDGSIEVQADGRVLPYREYDRITNIDQGAEVDNKRLASVLEVARCVQAMRDDRRAAGSPSRTHIGEAVRAKKALIGLKKQRAIELADINEAVCQVGTKTRRQRGAAAPPHPKNTRIGTAKHDISI
ncbi:ISNCY family transposase (plasmid) [Paraburkholderia sp. D15]|uniref:ISNCY family transposase n=1 Tax=Paraburkholderia sp. D15 TaxID=2880218 RepID=UPI0024792C3C|nr:ISNCY family transposase [Paraburkholderia sp. D15]WGS51705.1 ISNCY family transposase [Paraburkholderia sp. D15]WGS54924.1 ISNCY family transposase [Paraburkholderia sp. D15]